VSYKAGPAVNTRRKPPRSPYVARIQAFADEDDTKGSWVLTFAPDDALAAPFERALRRSGRETVGYTIEAMVMRITEVGDPAWASELVFDSEQSAFCVYCPRRPPLVHLARRIEGRCANAMRLWKLAASLPDD